ncbi:MAG: hypothetical protein WCP62_18025, partial [Planctomycetota bacterium]
MDAKRVCRAVGLAFLCCTVALPATVYGQQLAPRIAVPTANTAVLGQRFLVETAHFRVMSQDQEFARQVATMAEAYRTHLAMHWL